MPKKKASNGSARATLTGVQKEMAKSRVAKSAQEKYANVGSPVPMTKLKEPPGRGEIKTPFESEL